MKHFVVKCKYNLLLSKENRLTTVRKITPKCNHETFASEVRMFRALYLNFMEVNIPRHQKTSSFVDIH